jgi:hypothetical protein
MAAMKQGGGTPHQRKFRTIRASREPAVSLLTAFTQVASYVHPFMQNANDPHAVGLGNIEDIVYS